MFAGSTSGVKKKESGGGGSGSCGGGSGGGVGVGGQNKEMNMFVWSSSASPVSEANARNAMTRGSSTDVSTETKVSLPPHDNLASKGLYINLPLISYFTYYFFFFTFSKN